MDIEQELTKIIERNKRVEADKAWETSWVRRIFIALVTYVVALWWLYEIHETNFWLKAVVPVVGYLLSTLSLSALKKHWQQLH